MEHQCEENHLHTTHAKFKCQDSVIVLVLLCLSYSFFLFSYGSVICRYNPKKIMNHKSKINFSDHEFIEGKFYAAEHRNKTTQLGSYQQNLCKTIVRVLPSSSVLKSMVSTFFRWATSLSSFSTVESSKASSIFCSTFVILRSVFDTSQAMQNGGLPLEC